MMQKLSIAQTGGARLKSNVSCCSIRLRYSAKEIVPEELQKEESVTV